MKRESQLGCENSFVIVVVVVAEGVVVVVEVNPLPDTSISKFNKTLNPAFRFSKPLSTHSTYVCGPPWLPSLTLFTPSRLPPGCPTANGRNA